VTRSQCPLLEACWDQDWDAALLQLSLHPEQAFFQNENSRRTALHLATIPSVVASPVLLENLLETNSHAVVVQDRHKYGGTPLHFACGNASIRQNPALIRRLVQAAQTHQYTSTPVRIHCWSPLYLAARRAAPATTLHILVQSGLEWVAPWTGGETYHESIACNANDSPLEALWKIVAERFHEMKTEMVERMREVAQRTIIDTEALVSLQINITTTPELEAWMQCLVLLNSPVHHLVHRVSNLYHPIPSLLELVCHVFPEQALQPSSTNNRLPLHDGLRHDKGGRQEACIRILVTSQSACLLKTDDETSLYPAFLAAALDSSCSLVYEMVRLCPQVVQMQRV
jgi:chorismate mutase